MANLARYNPFSEVVSLREAMDRLFEDSFISPRFSNLWSERIGATLYETGDSLTLLVPMPGVRSEDVNITIQQDTLTLKWEVKPEVPEGATIHWNGFQGGQYQQTFTLPTPINSERVEAHYSNGVLRLVMPKAEHAKARTIKVNAR
ncbi:MAG: Hsp20/alpha crystallin family protein [Ktedonobacteraceae bacterium]|nr:Hsp20/alpha crystallin family protein [Ktedonobacteraceae bacterium]